MKKKKEMKKMGRPKTDLNLSFMALKPYLQLGYSFFKACLLSDQAYTTILPYYQNDETFRNKIDREKTLPNIVARRNIINALNNGDTKISIEWLERMESEEFAKIQKVEDVTPVEEGVILLREIVATRRKIKLKLPPPEGEVIDPIIESGENNSSDQKAESLTARIKR